VSRRRPRATTAEISTGISQPGRRPWAFTKGFIAGAVVVIPAIATTVWVLGKVGYGDPELRLLTSMRVSTLFIGAAAVITAGGVGRLAAQAAAEQGASRRRPLLVAGRSFAFAGAGLTIIAAIPHGHLPETWPGFLVIALAGAATGALCGMVIGATCGGAAPLGLTDVMALARWPTEALRALLETEDLAAAAQGAPKRKRRITIPFLFPAPKATASPTPLSVPAVQVQQVEPPAEPTAPPKEPTAAADATETKKE
jgi:hypothetical protein